MTTLIIIFILIIISLTSSAFTAADKLEELFLLADYPGVIEEGARILSFEPLSPERDLVYYYMGLSNMKLGNFSEARNDFQIILKNFNTSKFKERANLALADTYFLEENYAQANTIYEGLKEGSHSDILSQVYYKLAQANMKLGNWQKAKTYLEKLKNDFPLSFEASLAKNISFSEEFFTVQVGSFVDSAKAKKLCDELKAKGLDSYIVEGSLQGRAFYRVRVGKFSSYSEAKELEQKLSTQNYPTKIFP